MNKELKLSIIIPYYKTYELTQDLLTILIPQLTDETEVILVDDGTNDTRLDKYIRKNVHIIHNAINSKGCATPRNTGIELSKGKYIAFIDSDDLVTNDYISKIIDKINISTFDYCLMSWEAIGERTDKIIIRDNPPSWNWCVWNTIYNRDLIGNQRFNPKELFEDVDFNTRVRKGKRENIIDILYFYRVGRKDSLMYQITKGTRKKEDLL